uniref:Uncharacterized protein n=1 Tax=Cucumis melo TaxID=3656 RepID=A0A9I9E7A5_CUCME
MRSFYLLFLLTGHDSQALPHASVLSVAPQCNPSPIKEIRKRDAFDVNSEQKLLHKRAAFGIDLQNFLKGPTSFETWKKIPLLKTTCSAMVNWNQTSIQEWIFEVQSDGYTFILNDTTLLEQDLFLRRDEGCGGQPTVTKRKENGSLAAQTTQQTAFWILHLIVDESMGPLGHGEPKMLLVWAQPLVQYTRVPLLPKSRLF